MENIFYVMLIALAILAVADLIVGVSNDAVNFLNSAVGSKALSYKTILVVASIGIACGAIFSSGMMEVARKGIFNPSLFYFDEIMFIFMAVMITDILLLDFFNTIGIPTSTTVSIVFELLGAAVAMSLIKISNNNQSLSALFDYINTEKASQIIIGILLSVFIAFSIGAVVQWFTRFWLSFDFKEKTAQMNSLFGAISLSSITYFIVIKGIKGTSLVDKKFELLNNTTIVDFIDSYLVAAIICLTVFWYLCCLFLVVLLKLDIYKIIIGVGTFSLALAFAGNDLVNFIGVPIAAYQSYEAWSVSGVAASEFSMDVLASKVAAPTQFLLISGIIMIITMIFSKKARYVLDTGINLAREGESKERFKPNNLSRFIVRIGIACNTYFTTILPEKLKKKISSQFTRIEVKKIKDGKLPAAFDYMRASVNLALAGILISIATSLKLPLSTTYVTFMVAMGTSLADRAWGSETAVYRVAGVLNVIAGWFGTALIAFTFSGLVLSLIFMGEEMAIGVLLLFASVVIIRNYLAYHKRAQAEALEEKIKKAESTTFLGVIEESASNIAYIVKRAKIIYSNSITGLSKNDLEALKGNKKQVKKISNEVDELRNDIFYFIKNLEESSVNVSNFYISMVNDLNNIAQSLTYTAEICYEHVNNNHLKLRYNQLKEIKEINEKFEKELFNPVRSLFQNQKFDEISGILESKEELFDFINEKIDAQVKRIRTDEVSPKNSTLYFSILVESKDFLKNVVDLLETYFECYENNVRPYLK
ncbi:MAG: phosphate:sodium symporter [Flavobacteriaceae bacterium]|nr:phosphate:sodium symporter [Flavobacteriaceae bacterium]